MAPAPGLAVDGDHWTDPVTMTFQPARQYQVHVKACFGSSCDEKWLLVDIAAAPG